MRKRPYDRETPSVQSQYLALDQLAEVSVSSEDANYPVEGALVEGAGPGWRAATPGEQRMRIHFIDPRDLTRIHLVVEDANTERVQEFVIRWSADRGHTFETVVRQQFTFSPSGATRQTETYEVHLSGLTDLEISIVPDISNQPCVATLTRLALL